MTIGAHGYGHPGATWYGTSALAGIRRRIGARANAYAIDLAQRSERLRLSRLIHDTVLQSLESMSMRCSADAEAPAAELARLRSAARTEAARLRRVIQADAEDHRGLAGGIGEVVDEATKRGLLVRAVTADLGSVRVSRPRGDALCGATRAALSNVLRHSGTDAAVVRVELADRGLRVIVRDHGRGFVVTADRFGFGIRESIHGRLRDVGGRATVEASPGGGTRVTLWVPA